MTRTVIPSECRIVPVDECRLVYSAHEVAGRAAGFLPFEELVALAIVLEAARAGLGWVRIADAITPDVVYRIRDRNPAGVLLVYGDAMAEDARAALGKCCNNGRAVAELGRLGFEISTDSISYANPHSHLYQRAIYQ